MSNQEHSPDNILKFQDAHASKKVNKFSRLEGTLSDFVKKKLFRHWTDKDLDMLIQLYPENSNQYISQVLNKTKSSIDSKAFYLGLKKNIVYRRKVGRLNNRGKKQTWNKEDIEFLKKNYQTQTYSAVANEINRTPNAVSQKARQLKLRKYARYLLEDEND